tara:strand:- start:31 stop:936 length:906 start_codon:yes stop_codon:yes gene_type:complete
MEIIFKIVTILIDGITYSSWLFIVASGLTLVFGVLKILNIAHGSFYALGAYLAATIVGFFSSIEFMPEFSLVALLLAALGIATIVAPICERGILRFFYGKDEVLLLLVTFALFLILEDSTKLIWGVDPIYAFEPYGLFGTFDFGPLTYVGYDFVLIFIAFFVGYILWLGLNKTKLGKIILVVIHNDEIASSMGINISKIYSLAFSVGIFLAALGGALTAPMISVQPGLSADVVILSFAVVIIGGLGSIPGAAIGALFVGITRALTVHFFPSAELFSIYLVMVIVLVFKPEGIFKQNQIRKI